MQPKQEYDPRLTKPLKYSLRTCKPDDLSLLEVLSLFFLNLPRGIMASNPSMISPGMFQTLFSCSIVLDLEVCSSEQSQIQNNILKQ
jgi:hypothetical protein